MNEFMLLFRMNITSKEAQPTEEQMKGYMHDWMQWINEIAAQDRLAPGGNHLSREGRVLKSSGEQLETPHICDEQSVAGYILIWAENLDHATEIGRKCPILNGENTSVEIREIAGTGN